MANKAAKELRAWLKKQSCQIGEEYKGGIRLANAALREAKEEQKEKDAKVADVHAKGFAEFATRAKAKGHNIDDIVARRIASEDIAAAIRRGR